MLRAITSLRSLSAADPADKSLRRVLAIGYSRLVPIYASRLNHAEALSTAGNERALTDSLTSAVPENTDFAHLAAFARHDMANVLIEAGQLDEAVEYERSALKSFQSLSKADPKIGEYHADIALSLNHLADIAMRRGQPDAAIALLREATAETATAVTPGQAAVEFRKVEADSESLLGAAYGALAAQGPPGTLRYRRGLQSSCTWYRRAERGRDSCNGEPIVLRHSFAPLLNPSTTTFLIPLPRFLR